MKTLASKPRVNESFHRKSSHPRKMSSPEAHILPIAPNPAVIQRMSVCPCDGGCPRCVDAIQAKLTIGQPNDKYEQEADRIADEVMRMPEPILQRQTEEEEEEEFLQTKPVAEKITPLVLRQVEPEEEEEEEIQTKPAADSILQRQEEEPEEEEEALQAKLDSKKSGLQVSSQLESQIHSLKGSGRPLSKNEWRFFEPRFGHDFSHVRVHTDGQAAESARSVRARAFTTGRDVVFGSGHYVPETTDGKRLLAHELTHVIQQTGLRNRLAKTSKASGKNHLQGARDANLKCSPQLCPSIQCSRAVFISTKGRVGYRRLARGFHLAHGYPKPISVGSVEEMLEHMTQMSRPIEWVRIVSHAIPEGIFLPLLRGGGTTLFEQDLGLQRGFELEQELGTERPTVEKRRRGGYAVIEENHHVVPVDWVDRAWLSIARSTYENAMLLANTGVTDRPNRMTDMHNFFWWILDRELLSATIEKPGRRGVRMVHFFPLRARKRRLLLNSIRRNIAIFRRKVLAGPYAGGIPLDVSHVAPPERSGSRTQEQITSLETAITFAARLIIDQAAAEGSRFNYVVPSQRYRLIQSALKRATYPSNLLKVKYSLARGAEIQIRGCRIGQNRGWLEKFRDYFGHGEGTQRSRPHVNAPRLHHYYGLKPVSRRGLRVWFEAMRYRRGRGRLIRSSDPRFEANIVHVR